MKSIAGIALVVWVGMLTSPVWAENAMQVCGAKYRAAKANKSLPAGQTWTQFLAQCRSTLTPAAAPAASASPASASASGSSHSTHRPSTTAAAPAAAAGAPRQQTAGMAAAHDRQRRCGAQWRADKAAGKIPAGQTWPQYWSQCNTRLKGN